MEGYIRIEAVHDGAANFECDVNIIDATLFERAAMLMAACRALGFDEDSLPLLMQAFEATKTVKGESAGPTGIALDIRGIEEQMRGEGKQ